MAAERRRDSDGADVDEAAVFDAVLRGGVVPGPPRVPAEALEATGTMRRSEGAPRGQGEEGALLGASEPALGVDALREVEVLPTDLPLFDAHEATQVRMATVEALAGQNQWQKVKNFLDPVFASEAMSPALSLVYAIALRETEPLPGTEAPAKSRADAEKVAREALAKMLGAGSDSLLVRVAVKRLLRRTWSRAPAPSTRTSVLLIVMAVVVGAFIGFLVGPGRDWFSGS